MNPTVKNANAGARRHRTYYGLFLALFLVFIAIYLQENLRTFPTFSPFSTESSSILQPTVVDNVRDITYIGSWSTSSHVEHYENIFYAQEPSGARRFAPPVPVIHPRGTVINATQPGAWCPQATGDVLPFTSRVVNISENCLSLRVVRPRFVTQDHKLPVMVWLHGGGHALGSASDILYNADGLVEQAEGDGQPLIFVAINYRLGCKIKFCPTTEGSLFVRWWKTDLRLSVFGFATSDAMIKAKQTNAGLRDQRAALEWIRDNIAAFGGDPRKVTAIGQSVGASDISLQLTAFGGTQGAPFQQAILMSGGPGLNFNTMSDLVKNNTAIIADKVGCIQRGDSSQSAATLTCLQKAPIEILTNLSVDASRAARPPFGEAFFYPTYDDDFLPDRPSQLMRKGRFVKNVSVIASWVTNEGAWYASPTTSSNEEVLASFGLWLFGLSDLSKARLLELYPLKHFEHMVRPQYDGKFLSSQYYRAAQINKDIWFTCPVIDFAWHYLKNNPAQLNKIRLYEHNATRYTPSFEMMGVPMWRVAHLSDIPYVLNIQELGGGADNSAAQLGLSEVISRSIAAFVATGKPEGAPGGISVWPPAFSNAGKINLEDDFPSSITLQVFGGPTGVTPEVVTVKRSMETKTGADFGRTEEGVYWEKLFARCDFINSEQMREETGV